MHPAGTLRAGNAGHPPRFADVNPIHPSIQESWHNPHPIEGHRDHQSTPWRGPAHSSPSSVLNEQKKGRLGVSPSWDESEHLPQQLCVSTKSGQGLAQKHRMDPGRAGGSGEGAPAMNPLPQCTGRGRPSTRVNAGWTPAASCPAQSSGAHVTTSPPSFLLVYVRFNPWQRGCI